MSALHTVTVYVEYDHFPATHSLRARIKLADGYGPNLLEAGIVDINRALNLCCEKVREIGTIIDFQFDPKMKTQPVRWYL